MKVTVYYTVPSFPRLISRGLIEAGRKWPNLSPHPSFPRLISRGLIEAAVAVLAQAPAAAFPRLISRGLIEAVREYAFVAAGRNSRD